MTRLANPIQDRIHQIRSHRVVLDADLAQLYGVPTKRLNEQVRRNQRRFPGDFCFQLSGKEHDVLRSQIATSKPGRGGRRYLPYAFTEHGALMAANVLNSVQAIEMSIHVVRSFIKQREALATNTAILQRLAEIDKTLLEQDSALQVLWRELQPLIDPPAQLPPRKIGYHEGNR